MIAEIIVDVQNSQVDKVFDYNIPSSFDFLKIGYRVVVPFGNRKIEGYIIGIKNSTDCPPDKLKSIISVCDEYPLILPEIVELIKFMKDKLYLRLIDGIRLAIPSQVKKSDYKFVSFVTLNDENLEDYLKTLNKRNQNIPKIIECLRQNGKVEVGFLNSKYGNANVKKLIDSGILSIQKNKINRLKISDKSQNKVELTSLQKTCVKDILKSTDKPIVLYGVTGSGKTEVYMNVIDKVLSQGKTALMLVPEISLTPQMVRVFSDRFGTSIAVLHSALSVGEKHDEWLRIYSNDAKIVIGARSAIFAPLSNIGVIIIDEEHDSSYLSDSNPRYFTQDIAVFRAKYNKCPLVLGSATPSIETFYKTQTHEYNLTQMPVRVNQKPMPKIEIVDMCNEFRHGNNTILSLRLLEKLDETIKNNNQAILFINRRGFSSYLMCRECSYIPKCTECDANLVYHKDENVLKCHYCGKKFKVLTKCPQCGSNSIKLGATGTQQIVELIHEHFPKVSVFRLDNDSVKNKSSYSEILSKFGSTKPAILVGTQMVTKGHDFPKVTFVGILDADISLFNYSYKVNETTFQLVT